MSAENQPHRADITLRFVIDGVYYALKQNIYDEASKRQLQEQLIEWIPEAEIVELPEMERPEDYPPAA